MSARRGLRGLSQREAARVLHAALATSAWTELLVGLILVTGWPVSEIARRLRGLRQGMP